VHQGGTLTRGRSRKHPCENTEGRISHRHQIKDYLFSEYRTCDVTKKYDLSVILPTFLNGQFFYKHPFLKGAPIASWHQSLFDDFSLVDPHARGVQKEYMYID